MAQPDPPRPAPPPPWRWLPVLLSLVAFALPELVLSGADRGLWGSAAWRPMAYQDGAFWAGLLRDWQPNYAIQPASMFLTYAFLHAGPGHLLGNVLTAVPLEEAWSTGWGFAAPSWSASPRALGGAIVFGLLSREPLADDRGVRDRLRPGGGAGRARGGRAGRRACGPWASASGLAAVNLAMWVLHGAGGVGDARGRRAGGRGGRPGGCGPAGPRTSRPRPSAGFRIRGHETRGAQGGMPLDPREDPLVGGEEMGHRMLPAQRLPHPRLADPAHPLAQGGVVDQPGDLARRNPRGRWPARRARPPRPRRGPRSGRTAPRAFPASCIP